MPLNSEAEELYQKGEAYAMADEYSESLNCFNAALKLDPNHQLALYGQVFALRKLRKLDEAFTALDNALLSAPEFPKLFNEKGLLFHEKKHYEQAVQAFDQTLQIDEANESALVWKITSLHLWKHYQDAEEWIKIALQRLPNNIKILNEKGWLFYDQKHYEQAVQAFDQTLKIEEANEDALVWKIDSLRFWKHYQDAEEWIKIALERLPNNIKILNQQGWLFYDQKHYDQAVQAFDQTLKIDEANEDALVGKIDSLRFWKHYADAEEWIKTALQRLPNNIKILNQQGWLLYDQKHYEQSVQAFDQTLKIEEDNEDALVWKITSLRLWKHYADAEKWIEIALERLPKNIKILNQQGWLFYEQKHYEQAVQAFDQTLKIEEANEDALVGKIDSLCFWKHYTDAEKWIEIALNRLPNNIRILNQQGFLFYDQKHYEQAVQAFDQTLKIEEANEDALVWKITSLRLLKHYAEAEEGIKIALERLPNNIKILNQKGWLFYDQKHYEQAVKAFDQTLKIEEANEDALVGKITSLRLWKHYADAEEWIKIALERLPSSAGVFNEYGWLHLDRMQIYRTEQDISDQESLEKADAYFADAINSKADWSEPYFGRVEVSFRRINTREIREIIQRIKELFCHDLDVRERVGWEYLRINDANLAKEEFLFVLEKDKENILGINGIGGVYFKQGQYELAEKEFRKVLNAYSNYSEPYNGVAQALVRQTRQDRLAIISSFILKLTVEIEDRLAEAEDLCRKSIKIDPTYASPIGCLGIICFKRGNLIEAENYFRKSILIAPREGSYTELGSLYIQMERYEEAEEQLRQAIALNGYNSTAYVELGNLYLQREKTREAIQKFRYAMAIDPNHEDPPRALAIALMQENKLSEAESIIREALRRLERSKCWQLHLLLARLIIQRGDESGEHEYYEESLKEIIKAIKLRESDPEPYFYAGIVRAKLQDYSGAYANFKACLNRDKYHFEAERNARRVKNLLKTEGVRRKGLLAGYVILVISLVLLLLLWFFYFQTFFQTVKISETTLTVMTPILLGLVVVAFLLPELIRIKLPGLEAELVQPKETISSGPKANIGFGSSAPSISSGPR